MNGSWLVRFFLFAAVASIAFGLASNHEAAQNGEPNENFDAPTEEMGPADASDDDAPESDFNNIERGQAEAGDPGEEHNIFVGFGAGILAVIFVGSGVFEVVKIAVLMAVMTPLITKKSKNDELNRGRILGFIEGNAGVHFSALRDALGLANGVTAHHLQSLEVTNQIISWRDGKLRRYAASHLSIDQRTSVAHPIIGTRLAILETLSNAGQIGLSNSDLAQELHLSRQLTSYHMKSLSQASLIEKTHSKRRSPWKLTTKGFNALTPESAGSKTNLPISS